MFKTHAEKLLLMAVITLELVEVLGRIRLQIL